MQIQKCTAAYPPVYLRQFLIDRKNREQHYGKQAFQTLIQHLVFKEFSVAMRLTRRAFVHNFLQSLFSILNILFIIPKV